MRACVHACGRAGAFVCARACVRVCVLACVRGCVSLCVPACVRVLAPAQTHSIHRVLAPAQTNSTHPKHSGGGLGGGCITHSGEVPGNSVGEFTGNSWPIPEGIQGNSWEFMGIHARMGTSSRMKPTHSFSAGSLFSPTICKEKPESSANDTPKCGHARAHEKPSEQL